MRRIALFTLVLSIAVPALAVKTSHWTHTTEADFKQGTFKNVVTTNLGDLKLSREVKTLLGQDARVSAVYAMAQASDGTNPALNCRINALSMLFVARSQLASPTGKLEAPVTATGT